MAPYGEILRFSESRHEWQQDIIRRLYSRPDVHELDIAEGLAMVKAQYGLLLPEEAPVTEPLSAAHVPHAEPDPPQVILQALSNPRHVNRLAENETLRFATNGLTIIYGDNGSGKSGYSRLLKKLCRVRAGGEDRILANVFEDGAAGPAEVSVRFAVAGQDSETRWTDGTNPPEELSLITVFDAKTAPIYADQDNKIDYLPQGLDILPRLGDVCKRIGAAIQTEIAAVQRRLQTPLPTFPEGTTVATTIARLNQSAPLQQLPTRAELTSLAEWTDDDETHLLEIQAALDSVPEVSAGRCRDLQTTLNSFVTEVEALEAATGDEAAGSLHQEYDAAVAATAAAQLAATEAFQDDPLSGIGSSEWRLMFQYAREFSSIAYPEEPFPVVGDDRRCLLCLQQLSPDASARLVRFEQFIQDRAQAEAQRLQQIMILKKQNLQGLAVRDSQEPETILGTARDYCDAADTAIQASSVFLQSVLSRKTALVSAIDGLEEFESIPASMPSPAAMLRCLAESLEAKAVAFDGLRDPERRQRIEKEKLELSAQKKLSENLEIILQRADDLRELAQLQLCKTACETNTISRKNSEMRTMFFTDDFQRRLAQELQRFGLQHINFRIDERSAGGANVIGVRVDAQRDFRNKDILSEGEFKALALACFFAEVTGISGHSGIIFDDPVSSLDHLRTRLVAERLVEEAENGRQVIVFTHDLVFYYDLWTLAAERQVAVARHWVRHGERGFGIIGENEEPWQVKKVGPRIEQLQQKMGQIRAFRDRGDGYRAIIKDFYTDLRETWERLVEEVLLNQVVNRFQAGVSTQSLKGVVVEDEDHRQIFFSMKKASEYSGHDRAHGRQAAPPEPDEIARDLTELLEYYQRIRARRNATEEVRRNLENPPRAALA